MAFGLSFTNQRLISPNPTEFVGGDNFAKLLTVKVLTLSPELDAAGLPVLGEDGQAIQPALRDYTRSRDSEYYQLQEWLSFSIGDSRVYFLAGDAVFLKSLVNTIAFALVIVPFQSAFGLLLALLVNHQMRGTNIFRTIYFLPVVTSMVAISLLWRFLYSPENGLVNQALGAFSLGVIGPVDWLGNPSTALPAIMVMSMWQAVGFHMVIWLSGLQTIPGHLYEAASLDGAGRWGQFRYVTWPGLRNTAVFILITITIAALGLFTQIDVMTSGGPLDSTSTVIYQAVQKGFGQQDIAYGSAISVVFFTMVLFIALVQRRLTREG
jgi:multiple sugar transport system permease protein